MGRPGLARLSLEIDIQYFREARKSFKGSLHVYGDDSMSRFSGEMPVRLLHECGVLAEDLHTQVRELRRSTTNRIVSVQVRLKPCQGVFQE